MRSCLNKLPATKLSIFGKHICRTHSVSHERNKDGKTVRESNPCRAPHLVTTDCITVLKAFQIPLSKPQLIIVKDHAKAKQNCPKLTITTAQGQGSMQSNLGLTAR